MPLSASGLKADILSEMQKEGFKITEANEKLAKIISQAIIQHIILNGQVIGGICAPNGPIANGKLI